MSRRQLVIKSTLMNQIHGLPDKALRALMEKVDWLLGDPLPDGHQKKKLVEFEGVYRLRVGDYRVFYTFGADWVQLLRLEHRKDAYAGDTRVKALDPGELPPAGTSGDRFEASLKQTAAAAATAARAKAPPAAPKVAPPPRGVAVTAPRPRPLERAITPEWLASLKVPPEYHDLLVVCRDETALLDVPVPEDILWRVVDNLWPRGLDEVLQQPDYIVQQTEDLQRYKDGDLLGFLLRLDPEQERLVVRRGRGPALVKGGPGTGKSTVAIYRAKWILDQAEAAGRQAPRVLFTTYTNALTRFSQQLLEQLLGDRASSVTVSTADRIAWDIVACTQQMPAPASPQVLADILDQVKTKLTQRSQRSGQAFADTLSWAKLRTDFLLQEFEWVIEGRNLKHLQDYLTADRTGRGLPLSGDLRRAVWQLYHEFRNQVAGRGLSTYGPVRRRALELVRSGEYTDLYDAVIIDEAQDLTPTTLALLAELCRDPRLLFLTADGSQSIYSRGFTWEQVHQSLRFAGRTRLLRRNYRTSKEIAEAAAAFLWRAGAGDRECLDQDHVYNGPRPVLHGYARDEEQWTVITDFIRRNAAALRLPARAAAVLVPTNNLGERAADTLTRYGLAARHVRGAELDLCAPEVKVMTLHSAKGLEFPIVVVIGLAVGLLPRVRVGMTPEEVKEEHQAFRRLLYVGFTRAMRALLVTYPLAKPSPFVSELDKEHWQKRWELGEALEPAWRSPSAAVDTGY